MDINFELYKIFYHAANCKSFSDAAEKLYISQSAVSQAIKNLEEKIGGKLFFRKARSISLTAEGELLFKHVEQAFNFLKTAESKIFEMQNLNLGEIRIGVSDTICKYYLIPCLEQFSHLHPNVKIQVVNRTSAQILSILKNGQIDFGIVTLPVSDDNVLIEELMEVEDIFIAADKFSHLKSKIISLSELAEYPLLMLQKNSATRQNLDSYLANQGFKIAAEIELESVDLLVEFARIGLGIAHVLRKSAANLIDSQELFEVKTAEKLPAAGLELLQ